MYWCIYIKLEMGWYDNENVCYILVILHLRRPFIGYVCDIYIHSVLITFTF